MLPDDGSGPLRPGRRWKSILRLIGARCAVVCGPLAALFGLTPGIPALEGAAVVAMCGLAVVGSSLVELVGRTTEPSSARLAGVALFATGAAALAFVVAAFQAGYTSEAGDPSAAIVGGQTMLGRLRYGTLFAVACGHGVVSALRLRRALTAFALAPLGLAVLVGVLSPDTGPAGNALICAVWAPLLLAAYAVADRVDERLRGLTGGERVAAHIPEN